MQAHLGYLYALTCHMVVSCSVPNLMAVCTPCVHAGGNVSVADVCLCRTLQGMLAVRAHARGLGKGP